MSEESPTARLSAVTSSSSSSTVRPRLQLYQRQADANDVLFKANAALSELRPDEALALYTHVLHQLAPGNITALLNRSLCYIVKGHYELAAMDAYRAAVASHDMRDGSLYFQNSRYLVERAYLHAEEAHVKNNEAWTRPNSRYIADGWASSPLASIVINDQPGVSMHKYLTPAQLSEMSLHNLHLTKREDLCSALEVRAIYRLSGALFLCGGGARHDALGLLDDAVNHLVMLQWEHLQFKNLGNDIMADLTHEANTGNRLIVVKGVGHEQDYDLSPTSRAERMNTINSSAQSRSVTINHKGYPNWNTSEPDLSKEKWRKVLQNWVQTYGNGCAPRIIVQPRDHPHDACWTPYVELVAEKDLEPGDLIMVDSSIYNVTFHRKEQALPHHSSSHDPLRYHFCNVCATLLITPNDDKTNMSITESPSRISFLSSPRQHHHSFAEDGKYSTDQSSEHQDSFGRTGSSSSSHSFFHDFRLCNQKHMAPLCSDTCSARHETFDHPGICGTDVERDIPHETVQGLDLPLLGQAQRETKALHDLLLLRAMGYAIRKDKSLLHLPEVAFATAGINLNHFSASNRSEKPCHSWSFTNNIVKPISILHRICRTIRADPFLHLAKTEGWMLNIVLTKIKTAARITPPFATTWIAERTRHAAKLFDDEAVLAATFVPLEPLPDGIHVTPDVEGVRVGRLNPVLDMIRFAEADKGKGPNVRFEHNSGIHVYATVKIAKGELLIRSAAGYD